MANKKKGFDFTDDKYLISEQPAMMVILTGLIAAFFIGFSLKALFNPVRLTERVAQAAGRVHRDVSITFESAEMSLADGIFPDLAVIIKNVRLSSEKICWGRPEIYVDEIRLPISIISYLRAKVPIRKVDIHEMVVNIRSRIEKCEGEVRIAPSVRVAEETAAGASLEALSKTMGEESEVIQQMTEDTRDLKRNPIDRVSIFAMRVNYIPEPRYKAQFDAIRLKTKGNTGRGFVLDAKTHLFKDEAVGDFLSYANLHVEYTEQPEDKILVHFFGNLREGYYSLIGNYSFADHLVSFETELKHIPLSSVVGLSSKISGEPPKIHPKKLWLSMKAHSTGLVEDLKKSALQVRDVSVEGDLLELKTDLIEFESIEPLKYKPIQLQVKNLSLSELFNIYSKKLPSKTLGRLGDFSGVADIRSGQDVSLKGELRGLELNFSNRGDREVQVVERMNTEIHFSNSGWLGKVNRIELQNGVLSGDVEIQADKDFKKVKISTQAEEILFSEPVQKLMTGGGYVKPMKAVLNTEINEGRISAMRGFIRSEGFLIDNLEIKAMDLQLGLEKSQITINAKLGNLDIPKDSEAFTLLSSVVPSKWVSDQSLEFADIRGRFVVQSPTELSWHNVSGTNSKNRKVMIDGGWNSSGQVYGQVLSKEGNKTFKRYQIGGTRAVPVLKELKQ